MKATYKTQTGQLVWEFEAKSVDPTRPTYCNIVLTNEDIEIHFFDNHSKPWKNERPQHFAASELEAWLNCASVFMTLRKEPARTQAR